MFLKFLRTATVFVSISMVSSSFSQDIKLTAEPSASVLTMINILTPLNGNQDALVSQLELALKSTLVNEPGFISGNVHRSLDSKHVVNYAQWVDKASLEAFVAKLQAGKAPDMAQVFTMAKPDFHPYVVVSVHQAKK